MKYLSIDYGLKHLGLAISEGELAEPYLTLLFTTQEKIINKIKKICEKENINEIILGLPDGPLNFRIQKFGKLLEQETKISVIFQDETLTSIEAKEKMIESGKPIKKKTD